MTTQSIKSVIINQSTSTAMKRFQANTRLERITRLAREIKALEAPAASRQVRVPGSASGEWRIIEERI